MLESFLRTQRIAVLLESQAQVVIGARIVWFKINGRTTLSDRTLDLPGPEQDPAQICVGLGKVRSKRQGQPKSLPSRAKIPFSEFLHTYCRLYWVTACA